MVSVDRPCAESIPMFAYGEKLIDHDDLILAWLVGLMDKASASEAGDSRFESWAGHSCLLWMTLAAKTAGILAWEKGFLL